MASFNPRMSLGDSVTEGLRIHYPEKKREYRDMVLQIFEKVGLSPATYLLQQIPPPDFRRAAPTGGHRPGTDHQTRPDPGR